jgi:hypothetical protein
VAWVWGKFRRVLAALLVGGKAMCKITIVKVAVVKGQAAEATVGAVHAVQLCAEVLNDEDACVQE